jgi:hypothetical protein
MFNKKDFSADIAASMEDNLVSSAIEKQSEQINKFAKALDYLNSVAEIFDELGLYSEAEATTNFLEVVAAKKKKTKSKSKPKSKLKSKVKSKKSRNQKGLSSERMVSNLKEKGWVFEADDINYGDDHHGGCECNMCMDTMNSDDDNYHFDTEEDASYHVDRGGCGYCGAPHGEECDPECPEYNHDMDSANPHDDDDNFIDEDEIGSDWSPGRRDSNYDVYDDARERPTLPSTPVAKRHKLNEEHYEPGGLADLMDDLGYEYDPRMP